MDKRMKIDNPFESGHIKNYVLAYIGVVVIMVLFFIAARLFNEPKEQPKKEFVAQKTEKKAQKKEKPNQKEQERPKSSIKLLKKVF